MFLGEHGDISVHEPVGVLKSLPISLLVAHLVLDVVLDVADVIVFLHLLLDYVGACLGLSLAIVEIELVDIVVFLAKAFDPFAFERQVSLFDAPFLLCFLLLSCLEFLLLLLPHMLEVLLFELVLQTFLLGQLHALDLPLGFPEFLFGLEYLPRTVILSQIGYALDQVLDFRK